MELKVYSNEKYDRSNLRYVLFGLITAGILTGSIVYQNRAGAILLFFLLGWYFYFSVKNSAPTKMKIMEPWLQIGQKIFPRSSLQWFALEFDPKAEKVLNIVIVGNDTHTIHSIHDDTQALKDFVNQLSSYKPMLEQYKQTSREKILRKLKV